MLLMVSMRGTTRGALLNHQIRDENETTLGTDQP